MFIAKNLRLTCNKSKFLNVLTNTSTLETIRRDSNDAKPPSTEKDAEKEQDSLGENYKQKKIKLYNTESNKENAKEAKRKLRELAKSFANQEENLDIFAGEYNIKNTVAIPKKKDGGNSINSELIASAKEVAEVFGGDTKATENDLLRILSAFDTIEGEQKVLTNLNLKKQKQEFANLNHDKQIQEISSPKEHHTEAASTIHKLLLSVDKIEKKSKHQGIYSLLKDDLIPYKETSEEQSESNIFNNAPGDWEEEDAHLKFWEELEQDELYYLSKIPPRNYFEELILWTEQGKLWHFPINNEQGMEEEAKVSFMEHVFLDKHLEPWCPKGGPIRHFMELVLVGLSKNPYLSVKEKQEHIHWFRDYFDKKKKLLMDLGALPGQRLSSQ